jgi:cytochrome c553
MSNVVSLLFFVLLLVGCTTAPSTSGNAERGAQLFTRGKEETPPCSTCHYTVTGEYGFSIGPNLAGIGERAGARVVGIAEAEYLRQSILEPRRYIVSSDRDIMYPDYSAHLSEQNIEDLIAYLLTL